MVLLEDLFDTPFTYIGQITLRSGFSHSCGHVVYSAKLLQ